MKSLLSQVVAVAFVASFWVAPSCGAEGAKEVLASINKEKAAQPKYAGDRVKYFAAVAEQQGKLIELCQSFLKQFPTDEKAGEVKQTLVMAHIVRAQVGKTQAEDKAQARKLAAEIVAAKPSDDAVVAARINLVQIAALPPNPDLAAMEIQAKALATDYPKHERAPLGYYYLARWAQQAENTEKAKAAYEKLLDKFPNSRQAASAKGALRLINLVGSELTDLVFTDIDDKKIDIKDYKGKVVLVDFWATWCGPCRGELPNVKKTLETYADKGFEIIGVSLDKDEKKLRDFLKKEDMTWPQYFDGKGWQCAVSKQYGINSIPATFLVDRKGIVRYTNARGKALPEKVGELVAEE